MVLSDEIYQEGNFIFESGDVLILQNDGSIDALSEQALDNEALANILSGAKRAEEMVEWLIGMEYDGDTQVAAR